MVQDTVTGEFYRADHLMEGHLEKLIAAKDTPADVRRRAEDLLPMIDGMSGDKDRLWATMQEWKVRSPEGKDGNPVSEPVAFNLMFPTSIGPTGLVKGFLRPETAQGIFTNFKRLLEFNNRKMPFAAAQIGHSFRNEISPRSGLLRVRYGVCCFYTHDAKPPWGGAPSIFIYRAVPCCAGSS
jgi:glycyl-tRNA synthetase